MSLKNRARVEHEGRDLALFPNCVRNLADAASHMRVVSPVELVVADFHSDDWPLAEWLAAAAGELRLRVIPVDGRFSRGRGLNEAVVHAASDRLLLLDADILVRPSALRRAIDVLDRGQVWFPICRYLDEDGRAASWQRHGYGIAALTRRAFDAAGGVPEFYSYGGEDDLLFARLAIHVGIVREQAEGLEHQWHPSDVRFMHYARPHQCDFRRHYALAADASHRGRPVRKFRGEHPAWRGELHLFENGRVARPGLDAGDYVLEERRLVVLNWDRWPAVTLHWDEDDRAYRDRTTLLTLREISPEDPQRVPDD
jgi:glycosyltransferase involved in cell wall biosynthesis